MSPVARCGSARKSSMPATPRGSPVAVSWRSRCWLRATWWCGISNSRMEDSDERNDLAEVRWAPRVNPHKIRRLYETDARGIVDDELIEEVGFALYSRCQSILIATEAHAGRVQCPRCGRLVPHTGDRNAFIACDQCSSRGRWGG